VLLGEHAEEGDHLPAVAAAGDGLEQEVRHIGRLLGKLGQVFQKRDRLLLHGPHEFLQ